MSDRGRVLLIIGVVALVAGGAGFWFFKIHQPAEALKNAQAEITAWEARYQDARDCLLGKSPGSAKTSEALAIREMAPDPWDRGKCTPIVSKLSRGNGDDTGVDAVEAAWNELDKTAQKTALAFVQHVDGSAGAEDPLPGALDALDAARAKLRSVAELPANKQTGATLPAAQFVPLVDGKDPVTSVEVTSPPSAHGVVLYGKTASREIQISLQPGGNPSVTRVGPGSMRSVPDASWGATAGDLTLKITGSKRDSVGELLAGAMDAEGVIATPTKLPVTSPIPPTGNMVSDNPTLPNGERIGSVTVAAVSGTLNEGTIIYGAFQSLVVAHAKANVFTPATSLKIDTALASSDLDGRIALVWTTADKVSHATLFKAGGEESFELPATFGAQPCLTIDRVWLPGNEHEVIAFGGGRPLDRVQLPSFYELQGCTADAAIVRNPEAHRDVAICTDKCRPVTIPSGAPEYANVTAIKGKLVAIASHDGVVGVWTEDKPPVFYTLPARAMPVYDRRSAPAMAMTDGKVIDVIALSDRKYVVVRIPAP